MSEPRILYDGRCPWCLGHMGVQVTGTDVGVSHSAPQCLAYFNSPELGMVLVDLLDALHNGLKPVVDPSVEAAALTLDAIANARRKAAET